MQDALLKVRIASLFFIGLILYLVVDPEHAGAQGWWADQEEVVIEQTGAYCRDHGETGTTDSTSDFAVNLTRVEFDDEDFAQRAAGSQLVDIEIDWNTSYITYCGVWYPVEGTIHTLILGNYTEWQDFLGEMNAKNGRYLDIEVGYYGTLSKRWSGIFLEDGDNYQASIKTTNTDAQFQEWLERYQREGKQIIDFEAYLEDPLLLTNLRFAGCWVDDSNQPKTTLYYGLTWDELRDLWQPMAGRIIDIEKYYSPIHRGYRWGAIFAMYPGNEWGVYTDLDASELESRHNSIQDSNTHIIDIEPYQLPRLPPQYTYTALWGDTYKSLHEVTPLYSSPAFREELSNSLRSTLEWAENPTINSGVVGLYAKNLRTNQNIGYKEDEMFYLASMTKIAINTRIWQLAQAGILSVTDDYIRYTYAGNTAEPWYVDDRLYPGLTSCECPDVTMCVSDFGKQYNLLRLCKGMMTQSDNAATTMLVDDPPPTGYGLSYDSTDLNEWLAALPGVGQGYGIITSIHDVDRTLIWQGQVINFPVSPSYFLCPGWRFEPFFRGSEDCTPRDRWGDLAAYPPFHGTISPYGPGFDRYSRMNLNSAEPRAVGQLLENLYKGVYMDTIYSASAMSVMGGADRFRAGFPEGVPVDVMYSKGGSKGDAFSEASIMVFGPDALVVVFCSKDNNLDFDDVQDYIIAPVGWKTVKQLLPDLTVREPLTNAFFPQQTHAGETLLIWLPIVNLGGGHASPYDVDFYLSPNNNQRDGDDSFLTTAHVDGTAGYGTSDVLQTVTLPYILPIRPYFILWEIDPLGGTSNGDVGEYNQENNNGAYSDTLKIVPRTTPTYTSTPTATVTPTPTLGEITVRVIPDTAAVHVNQSRQFIAQVDVAQGGPKPEVLLDADFDDKASGKPIGTGGAEEGEPAALEGLESAVVQDSPFPSHSLEIIEDTRTEESGSVRFDLLDSAEINSGIVTIEADLWFSQLASNSMVITEQGDSSYTFCHLFFRSSGLISHYDEYGGNNGIVGNYGILSPVSVSLVFDMNRGTQDVFLDGVHVLNNEYHGITGYGIGSIYFTTYENDGIQSQFSIDNLKVTRSTRPSMDLGVTWSIVEDDWTKGTLDSQGLYTAPASVPLNKLVTIRATSNEDPKAHGSADITIVEEGADTPTPGPTSTVTPTATITLTPTITPTPTLTSTPVEGLDEIVIDLPGLPAGARPLTMVKIPAGSFMMGCPDEDSWGEDWEKPQYQVTIGYDYYLSKYEVTQAQWEAVMGSNPAENEGLGDNYPIHSISTYNCQDFFAAISNLRSATFRLPSSAEWEYACRAGTTTRFHFGDSDCEYYANDPCELSNYAWWWSVGSTQGAKEVGHRLPNAFGLYDMHGNVKEWCEDDVHSAGYEGAPDDGSAWIDTPRWFYRVVRGGGWANLARDCRAASVGSLQPGYRRTDVGLRLLMEVILGTPTPTMTPTLTTTPTPTAAPLVVSVSPQVASVGVVETLQFTATVSGGISGSEGTVWLDANFDDKPIGEPIGTGGAEVGEPVTVASFDSTIVDESPFSSPSLRLQEQSPGVAGILVFELLDENVIRSGIVTIEAELQFNQASRAIQYFNIAYSLFELLFHNTGEIQYQDTDTDDWQTIGTYENNKKISLKWVFDLNDDDGDGYANPYDLYIDGVPLLKDESHAFWLGTTGVHSLRFSTNGGDGVLSDISLDNIKVTQSEKPLLDRGVTWSILGDDGTLGSIDQNGLYTAPSTVPSTGLLAIIATSNADPSVFDAARLRIEAASAATPTPTATHQPTQTPLPPLVNDFFIRGIEVYQVLAQNYWEETDIPIPLIENKKTVVRVYPGMSGEDHFWFGPGMDMYIRRDNDQTIIGPLHANNQDTVVTFREDISQNSLWRSLHETAYEFIIPPDELHGTVTIEFRINPSVVAPETEFANNDLEKTISFEPSQGIKLMIVPVQVFGEAPTRAEILRCLSELQRRYPISHMTARWHEEVLYGDLYSDVYPDSSWVSFKWWILSDAIEELRVNSSNFDDYIWCGMLTYRSTNNFDGFAGMAFDIPAGSLWAVTNFSDEDWEQRAPPSTSGRLNTKDLWRTFLKSVFPHEVGHCMGRWHVESGLGEAGADVDYPFHPTGIINIAGYDTPNRAIQRQDTHYDLMAYSLPDWISEYTYRGIYEHLEERYPPIGGQQKSTSKLDGAYWFVNGEVAFDVSGAVTDATLSRLTEVNNPSVFSATPGPFRIESRNASGQVLNSVDFDLQPWITAGSCCRTGHLVGEASRSAVFTKYLPMNPEAAAIVLLATGEELDRVESSLNAPTVQVLFPNGGENLSGTFTISWTGSDQDGDRLSYLVDWSWDAGSTWEPLSCRIGSTTMEADANLLPGGTECLVRVRVTDGFLTAHDTSDLPFTVPDSPPVVGIIDPRDGQVFYPGDTIFFLGDGSDPETGSLTGESLTWLSDLDGLLGHGAAIASATLYSGTHTITLMAKDAVGQESTTSIQLFILPFDTSRDEKVSDWNEDGEVNYLDLFEFSMHWKEDTVSKATDEEELLQLLKIMKLQK